MNYWKGRLQIGYSIISNISMTGFSLINPYVVVPYITKGETLRFPEQKTMSMFRSLVEFWVSKSQLFDFTLTATKTVCGN